MLRQYVATQLFMLQVALGPIYCPSLSGETALAHHESRLHCIGSFLEQREYAFTGQLDPTYVYDTVPSPEAPSGSCQSVGVASLDEINHPRSSTLVATGLGCRVARVVLPLSGWHSVSSCSSAAHSGCPTGHHGVLGGVDTVGDNSACNTSTSIQPIQLPSRFSEIRSNHRGHRASRTGDEEGQHRLHCCFVSSLSLASRASTGDALIGAGNFLRGVTPNQDMMAASWVSERERLGWWSGWLFEVKSLDEPFSSDAVKLRPWSHSRPVQPQAQALWEDRSSALTLFRPRVFLTTT